MSAKSVFFIMSDGYLKQVAAICEYLFEVTDCDIKLKKEKYEVSHSS